MLSLVDRDLLDHDVEVIVSRYPKDNTGFLRHTSIRFLSNHCSVVGGHEGILAVVTSDLQSLAGSFASLADRVRA